MRVFVVGMPGAGNLGDDLISVMLADHIGRRWPQAEVGILSSGQPIPLDYPKTIRPSILPMRRRRSWQEFVGRMQAINNFVSEADLILIGGGGLFQDSHSRFTVHKWLRDTLGTGLHRIPAAAVGVGFGPFNKQFSLWYLKKALARLSTIQVRDDESADIVTSLGYSASISPDIVSGTSLDETPFRRQLGSSPDPALGCSIRPWSGLEFDALVNLICTTARKDGLSVRLFVFEHAEPYNTSENDYALRLQSALRDKQVRADVFCYSKSPLDEFAEAFSSVTKAIAVRFHANILWQKLGIPVLPISYAPKVTRLYKEQGAKAVSVTEIDQSSGPDMFQEIALSVPYSLPPETELLSEATYNPAALYLLGRSTSAVETGYGLTQSLALRAKQIDKLSP